VGRPDEADGIKVESGSVRTLPKASVQMGARTSELKDFRLFLGPPKPQGFGAMVMGGATVTNLPILRLPALAGVAAVLVALAMRSQPGSRALTA
jgi:hypothetical protein